MEGCERGSITGQDKRKTVIVVNFRRTNKLTEKRITENGKIVSVHLENSRGWNRMYKFRADLQGIYR